MLFAGFAAFAALGYRASASNNPALGFNQIPRVEKSVSGPQESGQTDRVKPKISKEPI